jgi:uncharacterized protein YdbL (DUF1318 family)
VAKDALQQSIETVAALKGEIEQLKAKAAGTASEVTCDAGEHLAQLSCLQKQLEQATISAEINKAKADLYDDVTSHAHKLEEEVQKLRSADMERAVSQQETERVSASLKVVTHVTIVSSLNTRCQQTC